MIRYDMICSYIELSVHHSGLSFNDDDNDDVVVSLAISSISIKLVPY